MTLFPLRLHAGQDLRQALEAVVRERGCRAAFVVCGIGSLVDACIRLADAPEALLLEGPTEILSLSGTVGEAQGHSHSHLHMAVSTASGQVVGGHVAPGCRVRTTAEVLMALLPDWSFSREADARRATRNWSSDPGGTDP